MTEYLQLPESAYPLIKYLDQHRGAIKGIPVNEIPDDLFDPELIAQLGQSGLAYLYLRYGGADCASKNFGFGYTSTGRLTEYLTRDHKLTTGSRLHVFVAERGTKALANYELFDRNRGASTVHGSIRTSAGGEAGMGGQNLPDIPTREVSLTYAAKKWFRIDRRTLQKRISGGSIKAKQESDRRWIFDLDVVCEDLGVPREDADPTCS